MNANGNFFAIDRRVWGDICSLKRINIAIAYLVLARGTLGDMRTTSWSVNAIEERTGIPRLSAKTAIQILIDSGFIERRKGGTKPQYYLRKFDAVREQRQPRSVLNKELAATLDFIKQHPDGIDVPKKGGIKAGWPTAFPYLKSQDLAARGLVRWLGTGSVTATNNDPSLEADWIWLPNTIIDGIAGEISPIERVRQTHSVPTMRLYVDLYHAQALSSDGGVNWRVLRESFYRKKVGEYANFDVYAFWPEEPSQYFCWKSTDFVAMFTKWAEDHFENPSNCKDPGVFHMFDAIDTLTELGLISFVPHAITADTSEGTVIHPMAQDGQGEEAEREVAKAAHAAASVMLGLHKSDEGYAPQVMLLPVQRHIRHVAVVGLARLRHRANTTATAAWFDRMDEWRDHADRYRAHEEAIRLGDSPAVRATSTGHQRGIKG